MFNELFELINKLFIKINSISFDFCRQNYKCG